MFRSASISVALIASIGLSGCGAASDPAQDEPTTAATSTATSTAGDVSRYCSLTRDLDAAGEKFFSRLERDAGTPEEFAAAERRFIRRFGDELEEIQESAPTEIRSDVQTLVASMRQRGGLPTATQVGEEQASAAEARIQSFERRHCKS